MESDESESEQEDEGAPLSFRRYKRAARQQLHGLEQWAKEGNHLALELIRIAMYVPEAFAAAGFEAKLYTALTNVVWVKEGAGMCFMSMREASGLAAFIDSILGETKRKDYLNGPYCGASTGEDIRREDENEMHTLIRVLGFHKRDISNNSFVAVKQLKELEAKYSKVAVAADRAAWEEAVLAWAGEAPEAVA